MPNLPVRPQPLTSPDHGASHEPLQILHRPADLRRRAVDPHISRRSHRAVCDADLGISRRGAALGGDRKSTRLNSSHQIISYAVSCLKKKKLMKFAVSAAVFEAHVLPYPHLGGRYMQLFDDVFADAVHHALIFFVSLLGDHRDLHSFPTRRSSD